MRGPITGRAALPPHRPRRWSYQQIQKLGRKKPPEAFQKANGTFSFPITDEADLRDAILSIGRAPQNERLAVKRWILMSAERLHSKGMIPEQWIEEISEASPHGLPR